MNWDQAYRRGIYSKEYLLGEVGTTMPVKPISPSDVVVKKKEILPDFVIEAFNEVIAKNYSGGSSKFKQEEVITLIMSKMPQDGDISNRSFRHEIFENRWLDVEDIYKKAGWRVVYDKPAYNETYPPTFTFTSTLRGS